MDTREVLHWVGFVLSAILISLWTLRLLGLR
jgi:hypothetical protein